MQPAPMYVLVASQSPVHCESSSVPVATQDVVGVGVGDTRGDRVGVLVTVFVGVFVGVAVLVWVGVAVCVLVTVGVTVLVGVGVWVIPGPTAQSPASLHTLPPPDPLQRVVPFINT